MKVPPEELTEGLQLLPYAEATYEERGPKAMAWMEIVFFSRWVWDE